jgi:hypothetical protein
LREGEGEKRIVLMLVYFETLVITRVGDYCDADVTIVASSHSSVTYY